MFRTGGCGQLPQFSSTEDPRRNCEKLIYMFEGWCELNGWYDSEAPAEETAEEADQRLKWQAKGKALAAFRSSIAGNKEPEKSTGEEYETDLLKVDIKPEIYVQTVYSTSQHAIGEP